MKRNYGIAWKYWWWIAWFDCVVAWTLLAWEQWQGSWKVLSQDKCIFNCFEWSAISCIEGTVCTWCLECFVGAATTMRSKPRKMIIIPPWNKGSFISRADDALDIRFLHCLLPRILLTPRYSSSLDAFQRKSSCLLTQYPKRIFMRNLYFWIDLPCTAWVLLQHEAPWFYIPMRAKLVTWTIEPSYINRFDLNRHQYQVMMNGNRL